MDFEEAMRRHDAAHQSESASQAAKVNSVAQRVAEIQTEFEQHTRDMIGYLNKKGVHPKRPFFTKPWQPSGYILVKRSTKMYSECTVLLPDGRIYQWRNGIPRVSGRLFERHGFKPGSRTSAHDEVVGFHFEVEEVWERIVTKHDDLETRYELPEVFVQFAQMITTNHSR